MYTDNVYDKHQQENRMALQIANPVVVGKIDKLARLTGLNKTAAVENAVDRLLATTQVPASRGRGKFTALLAQLDRIPDSPDAFDPMMWDDIGLPR